jgi:2-iminobutanoate/2-iminopropanoate deaminase
VKRIATHRAPAPAGHYSQAVEHAGLIFTSGLLPVVPGSGERVLGSIEEQAERVLCNLAAILEAAGSGRDRVLRVTVYLTDLDLWSRFNEVYTRFFGDHRPARTVVAVPELHYGFLLELEAVAAAGAPG